MKKTTPSLYHFLTKAFLGLMAFFVLLLCVGAFFFTTYSDNMETQVALIRKDNLILNILGLFFLYGIFICVNAFVSRKPKERKRLLLLLVLGWYLIAGLLLVVFGRTVPAADSMSVYSIAEALARGDTSVIHPTNSYISFYPQQIGLVAFYEVCIRFWNLFGIPLVAFHFLKCLNVLFACILIFSQYQVVHLLFRNDQADSIYLCLVGANLPLLLYTSFVYGEIPSLALFFAGFWILLTMRGKARKVFLMQGSLACILFALSVLLRKNMLIPLIALLLILLLDSLRLKKIRLLYLAISLAVLTYLLPKLTENYYEYRSGNEISSGVPPMTYFAMGMQEASRGNGWYNGYNIETYLNNEMDTDLTNAESLHEITARLHEWKSQPLQALTFYKDKYLTQWTDGTYACRQATLATFGGRIPIIQSMYDGDLSSVLIEGCNILQNLLFLGCLLFLYSVARGSSPKPWIKAEGSHSGKADLLPFVGLIAAFGGFVFHMLWEANSRYIFPYAILLLPNAAWGLSRLPIHRVIRKGKQIINGYK